MPSLDTIRTVTLQFKTDGADKAVAAANSLSDAQENVGKSAATMADGLAKAQQKLAMLNQTMGLNASLAAQVAQMQQLQAANDNAASSASHLGDVLRVATKAAIDVIRPAILTP